VADVWPREDKGPTQAAILQAMTATPVLLARLEAAVGGDAVLTDPAVLDGYRTDEAGIDAPRPAVAVVARSTADVQAVVRAAVEHRVPVVTRGAGTGLAGGANAREDAIVLLTRGLDRIVDIDEGNLTAEVDAGVITSALNAAVAARGLWYPPDPASIDTCTIGGNIATNAGGMCCLKYGVTGDFVLGLEVVLADGDVLRTGRTTMKGVAGYDLTRLFVGSEGTLGIVTRARLRLLPAPQPPATLVAAFPTVHAAGSAVVAATATGVRPSLLELMDRTTVAAVEEFAGSGLGDLDLGDAGALLLAQSDAGPAQAAYELDRLTAVCQAAGATATTSTTDPVQGEKLLAARRVAYTALQAKGATLLDDVAVPRPRIPELVERTEAIAAQHDLVIGTFGHIGDGNMHPTVVYDAADDAASRRARDAFDAIVETALDLGGTITGEHGVGLVKRSHLPGEIGPVGYRVHRAVKAALDPLDILNPGKAF